VRCMKRNSRVGKRNGFHRLYSNSLNVLVNHYLVGRLNDSVSQMTLH